MKTLQNQRIQAFLSGVAFSSTLSFLGIGSISAQPQVNCANPTSNIEYKECAHRDYLAADRQLNQVYKQIISSLKGEEKQQLIGAQLAWIKFRDTNCSFEVYRNLGGTGYGGFLSNCLERTTKARTKELQDWRR